MLINDKIFNRYGNRTLILFIALITALVYVNSLNNSFVWDDLAVVVENNFVKSWKNIPLLFSKKYLSPYSKLGNFYAVNFNVGSGEVSYRPVVTLSYFIDYAIWKLNSFGYHLTNLLLHIFNALLLFIFTNLIIKNNRIALLSSLLFALHPVNTEAVDAIAFREDPLVFLFFMSSFILYIKLDRYADKERIFMYVSSLILFLFALFSKEIAMTLPFILILYDYFFVCGQNFKNIIARIRGGYLGYFGVLLFYVLVRFILMANNTIPKINYPGGNFFTNIITMSQVIFIYFQWLIFPINIHVILREFHLSISHSIFNLRSLCSILIITFCATAIIFRKLPKIISFAILFFFITLLPVSNIWPIANFMASRYLYIPMVGFCLILATLLVRLISLRKSINFIVVLLFIFYALETMIRNTVWQNDSTLLSEMVRNNPKSAAVHSDMALYFLNKGLFDEAINEHKLAIKLNPNSALLYKNLSGCYYLKKDLKEASSALNKAAELSPGLPGLSEAYYNIGNACHDLKEYERSVNAYKRAIEINPEYIEAYNNLASTLADTGRINEAIELWNKAVQIDPDFATAHFNLAVFYFQQKNYDLAIQHCDKIMALGNKVDPAFLELLKPYRK